MNYKLFSFICLALLVSVANTKLLSETQIDKIEKLIKIASDINSSDHIRALQICDSTLELCKKFNYPLGEARITRIKGLSKFYAVDYPKALELFISSKDKFEKLRDTIGITKANNNIAIVYSYLKMNDKALLYHKQNLILREKIKDAEGIAATLNNIGVEFREKKIYDSSFYYYKKALVIELQSKDSVTISRYYNNIGLAYLDLKNYDSSKVYIDLSLAIRLKINELQGVKNSYQALGNYYFKKNNFKEAVKYQELSMLYANRIGIIYESESISGELAKSYEKLKLFDLAYKYSVINRKMLDSMSYLESSRKVTKIELERAFAIEQKVHELEAANILKEEKANTEQLIYLMSGLIIILIITIFSFIKIRKTNKLLLETQKEIIYQKEEITTQRNSIMFQNKELEKLNYEKDKFFSIIAHDLRSPFSGFLGIANLLVNNNSVYSKEDLLETSKILKESAENLYKLLGNLLEWSRIKGGLIDFKPEICLLDIIIFENIHIQSEIAKQKEIILTSEVENGLEVICDLHMLNTIIRNLLSNAIKFTNRGGKIEIKVHRIESKLVQITVKDNGIGMNELVKSNLFKIDKKNATPGTENEPSTGLGLILVKEFVEKNKGTIWVESQPDKGTTFSFTLELNR